MFGIIDESKKFILLDDNRDRLRTTALMLSKEETVVVEDIDYETGNKFGEHSETKYVPMFDEDTVDEAISEYQEDDVEIAYTGDKYIKGYAPTPDHEYQSKMREKAYEAEVDPITAHISRLRDKEQTEEVIAEIERLMAERDEKVSEIKARYPYPDED